MVITGWLGGTPWVSRVCRMPVTVMRTTLATMATNTAALGLPRNQTGTARFIHDGPPGAMTLEAAIANFTLNPAYIQPVRFQSVRESR